jgi:hypothetical protein
MKATVSIEKITPTMAENLLASQVENQRKLGERQVCNLAKEMAEGRFKLSCDAIVLIRGILGNGQHRLEAVRRTRKAQDFLVLRTDDDAMFDIIDCGKPRSIGDVLHGQGLVYTVQTSAIMRTVLYYDCNAITASHIQTQRTDLGNVVTRTNILSAVRENIDSLVEIVNFIKPMYEKTKIISITYTGSLLFKANKHGNGELARLFIHDLYTGSTGDDCPARVLREKLIKNITSKAKLSKFYIFALLIKAYNSYLAGQKVTVFKMAEGESFPKIKAGKDV